MPGQRPSLFLPQVQSIIIYLCMLTTGFAALGFETILFVRWSITMGYVYSLVPLLLAVIFLGIATGSLIPWNPRTPRKIILNLFCLDIVLILFVIFLNRIINFGFFNNLVPEHVMIIGLLFATHLVAGL